MSDQQPASGPVRTWTNNGRGALVPQEPRHVSLREMSTGHWGCAIEDHRERSTRGGRKGNRVLTREQRSKAARKGHQ